MCIYLITSITIIDLYIKTNIFIHIINCKNTIFLWFPPDDWNMQLYLLLAEMLARHCPWNWKTFEKTKFRIFFILAMLPQGHPWVPSKKFQQRNWDFVTNSNCLIPIAFQHDGLILWTYKLRLFDLTEFIL